MSDGPRISVVIPSYNCARYVASAVRSALDQTLAASEVIVVDDGLTDDTEERLAPWADRIRYIRQPNGGVSKARNRGIEEAHGELIAFLDADDQWLPEKLSRQWERLRACPTAALVHTDAYRLYEPAGERAYISLDRGRCSGSCYTEFFRSNRVAMSSVVVTRRCLEQVGPFDEAIRGASAEDTDLWLRIARHYPLAYVDEPLVLYRHHGANSSLNWRKMLEDEFFVLAKALEADPSLFDAVGRAAVRRRMFDLAFGAGYANLDAGDHPRARRYFREALGYSPRSPRMWALWASMFLPPDTRRKLGRMKRRLVRRAGSPRLA